VHGFARKDYDKRTDRFVLSRPHNAMEEMIFSRDYQADKVHQQSFPRFFKPSQPHAWEFAPEGASDCPVCQQFCLTLIFYNRKDPSQNTGLVEIKDKALLASIQKDFYHGAGEIANPLSPQICGTVVHTDPKLKAESNGLSVFDRKLLMMRADIYALLSLSRNKAFCSDGTDSIGILRGCQFMLELEHHHKSHQQIYERHMRVIEEKLRGWNSLLHERMTASELAEARKINYQPILAEQMDADDSRNMFVFPAYLRPGLHQFVIWDPVKHKAYVKELVLDLHNEAVQCPELPKAKESTEEYATKNVWLPWKADTPEQMSKAIEWDQMSGNFDLELFIKDRTVKGKIAPDEARARIVYQLV
jgi:hypothetical protein